MKKKQTADARPVRTPKVASQRKAVPKQAELPVVQAAAMIVESVATAIEPQKEVPAAAVIVDPVIAPPAIAVGVGSVVALPENCTLRDALAMKQELLNMKDIAAAVTIEIAAVKRIETANLQVIAAFVRDRRIAGLTVTWSGASDAMSQAVKLLGLETLLGFGATAPRVAA
jgi:phospholipid transport system transporter-binding protein